MSTTRYARFWKCDLQLQTPADTKHWQGVKLPPDPSDNDVQQSADTFIHRCHEVGLEVVGITDHNLGGELGLRYLEALRAADERYAEQYHQRLTILPGFEFTAHIPGSIHLLALFSPGETTDSLSHALTQLGLPPDKRGPGEKSELSLDEVLYVVQHQRHGIVIAAHADRQNGLLDNIKSSQHWQQHAILNPDLLAIELPYPPSEYATGRVADIIANRGDWRRNHPIAIVNSSDNKRISPEDGSHDGNHIGSRHTWIKMSKPSIEGLRQAFLDSGSRIRFGDKRPEELLTHPRITHIAVDGVDFLDGFSLDLPPGMTCLIGGGGTGKSTIIEAIRGATAHPPRANIETSELHERARESLRAGVVTLDCVTGDAPMSIQLEHGDSPAARESFPILALSQREAYAIASDTKAVLRLIDDLDRLRLDPLRRREEDVANEIRSLVLELGRLPELQRREHQLRSEIERLESELNAAERRVAPLAERNRHRREQTVLNDVDQRLNKLADLLQETSSELTLAIAVTAVRNPDTPHADAVEAYITRAGDEIDDVAESVEALSTRLRSFTEREQSRTERHEWKSEFSAVDAAYENTQGDSTTVDPSDLADLRDSSLNSLRATQEQLIVLSNRAKALEELVQKLGEIWREQAKVRQAVADEITTALDRGPDANPFLKVSVTPLVGYGELEALFGEAVDGRAMTRDHVTSLCSHAWQGLVASDHAGEALIALVDQVLAGDTPASLKLSQSTPQMLEQRITPSVRAELLVTRPRDEISVEYFHPDGTSAGTLEATSGNRVLSVGQRCAAIIAMMLAYGNTPVIIDQPEDEIDNEFIFLNLVPLIRAAKERRQVIIATHNPNIPVNGDAELIVAMTVKNQVNGVASSVRAKGSLDLTGVQKAVEEIMEGSRDAFERRRRRYGF